MTTHEPNATIEVYTADGWETGRTYIDLHRVAEYAREHGLLPIETEEDALAAAREAYEFPGPAAGLWFGRKNLVRLDHWRGLRAPSTLASRLRSARTEAGLSQAQLAERIPGVTQAHVSQWESGRRTPHIDSLVKLADALSVSLDWLTGRTP